MKLRTKMLLLFTLLVFIPLNILGMITYAKFSDTVEKGTQKLSTHIIDQINENIDRYVTEMSRLSLTPLYDQDVLEILRKHDESTANYPTSKEQLKMRMFISSLTYKRDELKGIHILTNDFYLFSDLDYSVVRLRQPQSIEDRAWYQNVLRADGKAVLIATHKPSYYTYSQEDVFSIARMINDPVTDEKLGIIKIDIRQSFFQELLTNINFFETASIFIMDRHRNLIYQKGAESFAIEEGWLDRTDVDVQKVSQENRTYLAIARHSKNFNIATFVMIPESVLLKDAKELRSFTLMLLFVCILTAVLLAVLFSHYLLRPVQQLKDKMNQAKEGNFEQRVSVRTKDEIGQLAERFNEMMDRIDHLIKQVYETKIREKEAELNALQSQIHPHFIYNTLESINMLAVAKKDFAVSDMVSSLGKLIRYTTAKHDRRVCLSEELHFIRSYIDIQKLRFNDRLRLELSIAEGCDKARIPKLLLQPLVENAIVHGLENGEREGVISIEAKRDERNLTIVVQDDGKGMSESRLAYIQKELQVDVIPTRSDHPERGIALKNIQERIRLLYGEPYGLDVRSRLSEGTVVSICIPLEKGEKDVQRSAG